jgi:hypothetical protein
MGGFMLINVGAAVCHQVWFMGMGTVDSRLYPPWTQAACAVVSERLDAPFKNLSLADPTGGSAVL